jgi:hypothetical protein
MVKKHPKLTNTEPKGLTVGRIVKEPKGELPPTVAAPGRAVGMLDPFGVMKAPAKAAKSATPRRKGLGAKP